LSDDLIQTTWEIEDLETLIADDKRREFLRPLKERVIKDVSLGHIPRSALDLSLEEVFLKEIGRAFKVGEDLFRQLSEGTVDPSFGVDLRFFLSSEGPALLVTFQRYIDKTVS